MQWFGVLKMWHTCRSKIDTAWWLTVNDDCTCQLVDEYCIEDDRESRNCVEDDFGYSKECALNLSNKQ
jgi:hypothetical protein